MCLAESAIAQTSPSSPLTVALSPTGKPWTQEHFTGLCESHQSEKPFYYTPITAHRLFPGIESEKCIYARRDNVWTHTVPLICSLIYVQNKSQLTGNNSLISSAHLPKMTPQCKMINGAWAPPCGQVWYNRTYNDTRQKEENRKYFILDFTEN